jgi:hypothetical protein
MVYKGPSSVKFSALLFALTLNACGGGSDIPSRSSCVNTAAGVCNLLNPGNTSTDTEAGNATVATVDLSLSNAAGATVTSVSPDQLATLQAVVKNSTGGAIANAAVNFTTTDKTGIFIPSSGTALTDVNGVARVTLPPGTQAGGFTVTAATTVNGKAYLGTTNYTVSFPTLTFSALAVTPATLSAGGTSSLAVTVLNGTTPYKPAQSVSFTSPCVAAGKATISSPVTTVNGVAMTSYTDKGCGGPDTITVSTVLSGSSFTKTGTINVLTALAGQIGFVSALPQNIAMKGTGGPGRQESSTVTFKVLDSNSNPVSGRAINFSLDTTAGGLTLNPPVGTSGADGTVSTVVAAGTVNTPVRVTATLADTTIATVSDQLVISTGIPDQNSFSLSTKIFNTEGMNHDGCANGIGSEVRVSLADHFNNPVPDGTAVSFTAEGGSIGASCLTGLTNTQLTNGTVITQKGTPGECTVQFCAAQPRPADPTNPTIPFDGRITILAYALGEESFVDDPNLTNSINRYDPSELFQDLCEPFRNDRAITGLQANSTLYKADGSPLDAKNGTACPIPALGQPYIDTNGDGRYTNTGDSKYNGVLNIDPTTQKTVADGTRPTVHVRSSLVQVLSTSAAAITPVTPEPYALSHCTDGTPFFNVARPLTFAIRDTNPTIFPGNSLPGNILPAGTTIQFTTSNGTLLSEGSFVVPNTNEPSSAVWTYSILVQSDASQTKVADGYICTNTVTIGSLSIKVTTPLGIVTTRSFSITD